jgi:hypothetical protein
VRRLLIACGILVCLLAIRIAAQSAPLAAGRESDISGQWLNNTMTPLARPLGFADKAFFSEPEVRDFESHFTERTRARGGAFELLVNSDEFEPGHVLPSRRTSLIVDPPDGQVPPLTSDALTRAAARDAQTQNHFADGPENFRLSDQCIVSALIGPPMMAGVYNNNLQIVQTSTAVMIFAEMLAETRVIHLDGQPHLPSGVRQWKGDSRGHWEHGTLIVDTTNFTDRTTFNGSGEHLHVIERFTRMDTNTLRYEFTIDDPASFTRSWSAESEMSTSEAPMFEYACHEGDYSLEDSLKGARFAEKNR